MTLLEKLAKLDSSLQRGLDNGMAFVFGGKVVPAEIEELLKQAAQAVKANEPGTLRYHLQRETKGDAPVFVVLET